jgi:molybdopterin-guanine dinucleotide biosynthesis protein A
LKHTNVNTLSYHNVTALILAGGNSSRMGRDKAFLKVGGVPLITRVYDILKPLFADVLTAAGRPDDERGPFPGRIVHDATAGMGPLGGLVAGLKAAKTQWLFMVACDMPHLDPRVIARIVDERLKNAEGVMAVVPESEGGLESCHALYAKAALPIIEQAMAKGERAPYRLFERLNARIVAKADIAAIDPTFRALSNLNTPEDLKRG